MRRLAALATAATVVASGGLATAATELGDSGSPLLAQPGAIAAEDTRPVPAAERRAAGRTGPLAAVVVRRTALRASPRGRLVARIGRQTEFRLPQTLAVVGRRRGWLGVLHHRLPNGRTGWIRAADARLYSSPWRIVVDRSDRVATLTRHGRLVERFEVGVGRPGSPTPLGRFAITDRLVTRGAGSPYGCCILALSGRQTSLPSGWSGGDRLALHGKPGDTTASTAGCISARRAVLRRLLRRVAAGTRVDVRA